jgi:hypothetical protein
MRTVHETEALRPSDPVPKHHSSNPSNNKQRIKLILNNDGKKTEKGSTPASPSSHSHPPNSAPLPPPSDADYAHNNVLYLQDITTPNAPVMVQFPPDLDFTERELSLPAPELFQLLRRQLQWTQQESDQLRTEAEALEAARKQEWEAKEILVENLMEAEVATERRKRAERGELEDYEGFDVVEKDVQTSKSLPIKPKDGKLPWWRETQRLRQHPRDTQLGDVYRDARPPPADIRQEGSRTESTQA